MKDIEYMVALNGMLESGAKLKKHLFSCYSRHYSLEILLNEEQLVAVTSIPKPELFLFETYYDTEI